MTDIDHRPSRHNESLDETDARFAFGAAVAGAAIGMLGLTAALLALFVSWPQVGRSATWVSVTAGLLQASGILMLIGMCCGAIAVFAPGLPRRLGLLVAALCILGWMGIYVYSSWPTANTLVGAAEKGDWEVVRIAIMLGIDPEERADPDAWDPRYGFDESQGRSAIEVAIQHDHLAVIRELQSAGVKLPEGYARPEAIESRDASVSDSAEQDAPIVDQDVDGPAAEAY